jgi:hypothetical protein
MTPRMTVRHSFPRDAQAPRIPNNIKVRLDFLKTNVSFTSSGSRPSHALAAPPRSQICNNLLVIAAAKDSVKGGFPEVGV